MANFRITGLNDHRHKEFPSLLSINLPNYLSTSLLKERKARHRSLHPGLFLTNISAALKHSQLISFSLSLSFCYPSTGFSWPFTVLFTFAAKLFKGGLNLSWVKQRFHQQLLFQGKDYGSHKISFPNLHIKSVSVRLEARP